jgi:hypothetical protein
MDVEKKIQPKQGVYQDSVVALPFTLKSILKAKEEELWKLKYFTMQKYNLQKKSSKRIQNPSRYYNSIITNLSSFNTSQNIMFQKSSYKNK